MADLILQLSPEVIFIFAVIGACFVPMTFVLIERLPRVKALVNTPTVVVEPALIGTVSLMFGLFSAFLANDIWSTNVAARTAVIQEADGVQAMLRFSEGLADAEAKLMYRSLHAYLKNAIENEWHSMEDGIADKNAETHLKAISSNIITFEVGKRDGPVIQGHLLDTFNQIRMNWQIRTRIAQERDITIKWRGVLLFGLLTQAAIAVVHFRRRTAMLIGQAIFGTAFAITSMLLVINEFPFSRLDPVSNAPLVTIYQSIPLPSDKEASPARQERQPTDTLNPTPSSSGAASAPALDRKEEEKREAVKMVDAALAFYKKHGKEATLAELDRPQGAFVKGELYVFAYDLTGTMIAHPVNPKLIGKLLYDVPDSNGKFFRREIVKIAKAKGVGWSDYMLRNPVSGQIEPKATYFRLIDDTILCAGVYR